MRAARMIAWRWVSRTTALVRVCGVWNTERHLPPLHPSLVTAAPLPRYRAPRTRFCASSPRMRRARHGASRMIAWRWLPLPRTTALCARVCLCVQGGGSETHVRSTTPPRRHTSAHPTVFNNNKSFQLPSVHELEGEGRCYIGSQAPRLPSFVGIAPGAPLVPEVRLTQPASPKR